MVKKYNKQFLKVDEFMSKLGLDGKLSYVGKLPAKDLIEIETVKEE